MPIATMMEHLHQFVLHSPVFFLIYCCRVAAITSLPVSSSQQTHIVCVSVCLCASSSRCFCSWMNETRQLRCRAVQFIATIYSHAIEFNHWIFSRCRRQCSRTTNNIFIVKMCTNLNWNCSELLQRLRAVVQRNTAMHDTAYRMRVWRQWHRADCLACWHGNLLQKIAQSIDGVCAAHDRGTT